MARSELPGQCAAGSAGSSSAGWGREARVPRPSPGSIGPTDARQLLDRRLGNGAATSVALKTGFGLPSPTLPRCRPVPLPRAAESARSRDRCAAARSPLVVFSTWLDRPPPPSVGDPRRMPGLPYPDDRAGPRYLEVPAPTAAAHFLSEARAELLQWPPTGGRSIFPGPRSS